MTREEHLKWSKDRAFEILEDGNVGGAWASMVSDLRKHEDLRDHSAIDLGMMLLMGGHNGTVPEMRRFIDGFN